MGRGLPLGPMVTTVLAVAAANVLLAYGLAHAIGGRRDRLRRRGRPRLACLPAKSPVTSRESRDS